MTGKYRGRRRGRRGPAFSRRLALSARNLLGTLTLPAFIVAIFLLLAVEWLAYALLYWVPALLESLVSWTRQAPEGDHRLALLAHAPGSYPIPSAEA